MIESHGNATPAAVLTLVLITFENVLARQNYIVTLNLYETIKFDNARQGEYNGRGMYEITVVFDHFNFV